MLRFVKEIIVLIPYFWNSIRAIYYSFNKKNDKGVVNANQRIDGLSIILK